MNNFNAAQIVTINSFMAAFAAMGVVASEERYDEPSDQDENDGYLEATYTRPGLQVTVILWDDHNFGPELYATNYNREDLDLLAFNVGSGNPSHVHNLWAAMRKAVAADA